MNLKAYVYNALNKTDSCLKHKFDLKHINFSNNPNNPNDADPIQTNTTDLNYTFNDDDAITKYNSNLNTSSNNDKK